MANEHGRRSPSGAASDRGFAALKARIIARTGHHYYADKDELLYERLVRRFRALKLPDAAAYTDRLDGADGEAEWAALEAEVTIGETFFFRYAEQFAALRNTILPSLISARGHERRLRIWSAGCSTGAEAYSVAILVHDLLGARLQDWDVTIVGTDISAAAVATAREGAYGRWALRTMPQEDRNRWFRAIAPAPGPMRDGGYRLRPEFRSMVRFERQNLIGVADGSLPESYSAFDLILCRNVLIYFSTDVVLGIIRGFGTRLCSGGWLLLGHAEPSPAYAAWLAPVQLPGTVAYRREEKSEVVVAAAFLAETEAEPILPLVLAADPVMPLPVMENPQPLVENPQPLTLASVPSAPEPTPAPDLDLISCIRALADAGRTAEAWRMLSVSLSARPTDAVLRLYEGLIAIGLGRAKQAEQALRGALFLKRDFVMAHYHLGLMLIGQGRLTAGRRALDNALQLAQALAPDSLLLEGDGVTAGELVKNILLARGGSDA